MYYIKIAVGCRDQECENRISMKFFETRAIDFKTKLFATKTAIFVLETKDHGLETTSL